jgi:hypothetical protein
MEKKSSDKMIKNRIEYGILMRVYNNYNLFVTKRHSFILLDNFMVGYLYPGLEESFLNLILELILEI